METIAATIQRGVDAAPAKTKAGLVLAFAVLAGIVTRALTWHAALGMSWLLLVAGFVGATLLRFGRSRLTRTAGLWALAATWVGAAFVWYASDWAIAIALPASAMLTLALPLVVRRRMGAADLGELPRAALETVERLPGAVVAAARVPREALSGQGRSHARGVLRGLVAGAPLTLVFVVLLSSDPAFAAALGGAFGRSLSGADFALCSALFACAWLVAWAAFLRDEAAPAAEKRPATPYRVVHEVTSLFGAPATGPRVRPITWGVVVAQIAAVFGLFVAVNARAMFGGHAFVREPGVTYASHLHAGFAALSVATLLAVMTVLAGHALLRDRAPAATGPVPGGRALAWLELSLLVLTSITLLSCWQRLSIYEEAYGYTLLRLGVAFAQLAIAGLLVLTGVKSVARGWRGYGAAVVALAASLAVVASSVNADLYVARGNVGRSGRGHALDASYLASLSADASAVLDDPRLPAGARATLREAWAEDAAGRAAGGWRAMRGAWGVRRLVVAATGP